jgi:zinc transporter, ZIP family
VGSGVLEAFGWGFLAQSSLLVAGLLVCWVTVPTRLVGILGGFGAGAMIAAVSFDLLPEAEAHIEPWQTAAWMIVGVAIFLVADAFVERRFGSEGPGAAMGIVVGSVVDGIPESMILGIQVGAGLTISISFVAAVFISNIPQAIAPSADLAASGWGPRRLGGLWLIVVLACGAAAALGFLATDLTGAAQGDRAAAVAAGGLLAMLTNSLMPFSFERGGALAGAATALGFCVSVLGS